MRGRLRFGALCSPVSNLWSWFWRQRSGEVSRFFGEKLGIFGPAGATGRVARSAVSTALAAPRDGPPANGPAEVPSPFATDFSDRAVVALHSVDGLLSDKGERDPSSYGVASGRVFEAAARAA